MASSQDVHRRGNYAKCSQENINIAEREFQSFVNPWLFHTFFASDKGDIINWFQVNGLLKSQLQCVNCNRECKLTKRARALDGYTYRCESGNHEFSLRSDSFFENFRFSLADIFLFMVNLVDGMTLKMNALKVGVNYRQAAPKWAKLVREVMADKVWREYFSGDAAYKMSEFVQCDESKFGRKVKANTGCPRGRCVWLMGLIERNTGRLLLLPIKNR